MSLPYNLYRRQIWLPFLALAAGALWLRFAHDYNGDSPTGVALGATTFALIAAVVVSGRMRRGTFYGARFFGRAHAPLAVVACAVAVAHWHFRWREYAGLATALLFMLAFLSSGLGLFRRRKHLRVVHKLAGYAVLSLAPIHGIQALFFPSN